MHNWIRQEPLERTLDRLAQCGFDSIELSGEPERWRVPDVRAQLKARKLGCWGVVSVMTPGRDLVHADPYMREATVRYMKDCVRITAELDGQIFCTVPSTVGKLLPVAAPEDEWRWAVEGLQEVEAFARPLGVRVGVEPITRFETYFLNRHDQALRLAQDVGGTCGVILDTFHLNIEENDLLAAIRNTGKYLVGFHVADNNRYPPGQGALCWRDIIATLRETGYDGALTVEYVLPADVSPLAGAQETGEYVAVVGTDTFIRDHGGGTVGDARFTRLARESVEYLRALVNNSGWK
jgi:sugar phosphate isomerase/epimerase